MFGFDGSCGLHTGWTVWARLTAAVYPIRTTITDHLKKWQAGSDAIPAEAPLIDRHEHPGYTLSPEEHAAADEARRSPLETYEVGHASYARHVQLRGEFAQAMRDTRICVFDSSLERKMIRKVGGELRGHQAKTIWLTSGSTRKLCYRVVSLPRICPRSTRKP